MLRPLEAVELNKPRLVAKVLNLLGSGGAGSFVQASRQENEWAGEFPTHSIRRYGLLAVAAAAQETLCAAKGGLAILCGNDRSQIPQGVHPHTHIGVAGVVAPSDLRVESRPCRVVGHEEAAEGAFLRQHCLAGCAKRLTMVGQDGLDGLTGEHRGALLLRGLSTRGWLRRGLLLAKRGGNEQEPGRKDGDQTCGKYC